MDPIPNIQLGPPTPPTSIKSTSPFAPHNHQCCRCNTTTPSSTRSAAAAPQLVRRCSHTSCAHDLCGSCNATDTNNNAVIPHSFPADWVCATCNTTHSVLSILTRDVSCDCGAPRLQAIYDQFGRIFLFWRDDPTVQDLRDPAKVQEAAWRIWEAGGEPWVEEVERVEAKRERGWSSRLSSSSLDSEEEAEVEMGRVERL
ncbi:hypothetical protein OQA88_2910 [Cercophora sp. LCS_1]